MTLVNNNSGRIGRKTKLAAARRVEFVDQKAERIMNVLGATRKSWRFYCKCATYLPEAVIENALEAATGPQVKNPAAYFGRICAAELFRRGH